MSNKLKASLLFLLLFLLIPFTLVVNAAGNEIILYTPYTGLSVTPGEGINYDIDVINNSRLIQNLSFKVKGLPAGWDYNISSGGKSIEKLAIKSKDFKNENDKSLDLEVNVPLKIEKGNYHFTVIATTDDGQTFQLPLAVKIAEKGIFETEFTVEQNNMEGYSDSTFSYDTTLRNRTAEKQHYALKADAPQGWDVRFKEAGSYVTSVTIDSGESKTIDVKVEPAVNVKADNYAITVEANSGTTAKKINLEAVIKGKYGLDLTTPSGRLSQQIVAGKSKELNLKIKNTGTITLRDIKLSATTPSNWSVDFEKDKITKLEAGESTTVSATVKASDQAIAGDYQLSIKTNTPEATAAADFRITVKTSLIWGWVGILIILAVILVIFYFVKKYGRR
jgi:uncharacterized membrane protein